ncbi:MAG: hypothetical protein M3Y13_01980 [Armatimonadota bacterium]|nr:hypothetical protein [Armatimonadota bacterium]
MREMLYEHNTLNGFWFSLIEFLLVALFCLFLGAACLLKGNIAGHLVWAAAFLGIAVNAAVICGTVIEQMRRGERSSSLHETYSAKGRERVRREHPNLDRHTLQIVIATAVPFLLAFLTLRGR